MPRPASPFVPVLAMCLALPGLALAQSGRPSTQAVQPAPKPADGPMRDFSLRNMSSQAIVEAHAGMADGTDQNLTVHGQITVNHAQSFHVRPNACLGSVSVKFKNGKTLHADNMNDCDDVTVVVHDDRIEAATSAVPGTTPTPGESPRGTRG